MSQTIEGSVTDSSTKTSGHRPNSTLIVIYLSLGGIAYAVLQSLVAPALSTIGHDLNASTSDVSWILTAYLLSASVLTPIMGRLGDMVMLTSFLHLLHQRFGSACEVFAAGPWNEPLYRAHPDVAWLWLLGRHTPTALGLSWWRAWWQLRRSGGRPFGP